jgi:hypothetical protein
MDKNIILEKFRAIFVKLQGLNINKINYRDFSTKVQVLANFQNKRIIFLLKKV